MDYMSRMIELGSSGERYVNMTVLCLDLKGLDFPKAWELYTSSDASRTFLKELSDQTKVPVSKLVVSDNINDCMWIHISCAYHFASQLAVPSQVASMFSALGRVNDPVDEGEK